MLETAAILKRQHGAYTHIELSQWPIQEIFCLRISDSNSVLSGVALCRARIVRLILYHKDFNSHPRGQQRGEHISVQPIGSETNGAFGGRVWKIFVSLKSSGENKR